MQCSPFLVSTVALLFSATVTAGIAQINEQDNLFAFQAQVQPLEGDMTNLRWHVTNRTKTGIDLRFFRVAYQCGDEFIDVLDHEYRGLIAPGKSVELPGDYYVCIRHRGIKQHSFIEVSFSQAGMPVANNLHCSNGSMVSFVVEPITQHGYRLRTRKGDVITLAGNEMTESRLTHALCNGSTAKEPGIVSSLIKWVRDQQKNDTGKPVKQVSTGGRG